MAETVQLEGHELAQVLFLGIKSADSIFGDRYNLFGYLVEVEVLLLELKLVVFNFD